MQKYEKYKNGGDVRPHAPHLAWAVTHASEWACSWHFVRNINKFGHKTLPKKAVCIKSSSIIVCRWSNNRYFAELNVGKPCKYPGCTITSYHYRYKFLSSPHILRKKAGPTGESFLDCVFVYSMKSALLWLDRAQERADHYAYTSRNLLFLYASLTVLVIFSACIFVLVQYHRTYHFLTPSIVSFERRLNTIVTEQYSVASRRQKILIPTYLSFIYTRCQIHTKICSSIEPCLT